MEIECSIDNIVDFGLCSFGNYRDDHADYLWRTYNLRLIDGFVNQNLDYTQDGFLIAGSGKKLEPSMIVLGHVDVPDFFRDGLGLLAQSWYDELRG